MVGERTSALNMEGCLGEGVLLLLSWFTSDILTWVMGKCCYRRGAMEVTTRKGFERVAGQGKDVGGMG